MSDTLHEASMVKKREQLMAHYGWVYEDNAEKERDFKIFHDHVELTESFKSALNRFRDLTNAEKETDFKIFQDHVELIESFKSALNRFRDLTNAEFRASHNVYKYLKFVLDNGPQLLCIFITFIEQLERAHDNLKQWQHGATEKLDGSLAINTWFWSPSSPTQFSSVLHHQIRVSRVWKTVKPASPNVSSTNGWS
ncbi:unnamed protein product [Camellia sinensis]